MSLIGGVKREQVQFEQTDFVKKVGLFEANVICLNPDAEEFKDKNFNDKLQIGVIAQDLEKIYPDRPTSHCPARHCEPL